MTSKRIFIAVDISDEARCLAAEHIDKMRQHAKDVRVGWERPEKLHVTLKFLGNVDEAAIDDVVNAVAPIADIFSAFEMAIIGTGVFPNPRQPRVLWLGVQDEDDLQGIAAKLDLELAKLGFEKEMRRFDPHLTIARIREPQKAKRLAEFHLHSRFESQAFAVHELVIYESVLRPTGSVYSVISRHAL